MSVYWTTEDLDAGRCGVDDLGRARPVDVVLLQRIDHTPEQCVQAALNALVRACEQPRDPEPRRKAAALLLNRFLGRVVPQAPQAPAQALPEPQEAPALSMDEEQWLNRFARSARLQTLPYPPASRKSSPLSLLQSLPRLRIVQPKPLTPAALFYDSPTQPAVGPYRDPTRLN